MDNVLYNKKIICPVCSESIEITKVKSKAFKVVSRDSDFYVHYEDINPIFYDIWVCEFCGYAASADRFEEIGYKSAKLIKENIAPKWKRRSFTGERDVDKAIEAFMLALYNAHLIKAKAFETAKICMRIAWLYRIQSNPREKEFLAYALKNYNDVFENERLPVGKFDESMCMYMIAELNRRTDNYEEAIKWFSRIISSPEARKNKMLMENTREMFQLAKEAQNNT